MGRPSRTHGHAVGRAMTQTSAASQFPSPGQQELPQQLYPAHQFNSMNTDNSYRSTQRALPGHAVSQLSFGSGLYPAEMDNSTPTPFNVQPSDDVQMYEDTQLPITDNWDTYINPNPDNFKESAPLYESQQDSQYSGLHRNSQVSSPQPPTASGNGSDLSDNGSPQEPFSPYPPKLESHSPVSPIEERWGGKIKKTRDMNIPKNQHRKHIEEKCNQRRKDAMDKLVLSLKQRGHEQKSAAQQFEVAAELLTSDATEIRRLREQLNKVEAENRALRKGAISQGQVHIPAISRSARV
ncbi:hypothetical protein SISSUDRAFT_186344 [Sistotremastrum suecicum HHB10207 ss-3]|uniref:Uncharacterized protein n=1 Tax=Sistotremastrum suecicum HHB10207 ss-3 TaxID=1314776 RepID=A0A166AG66_9AGAM|nr:hypothetical protein SISSUDRAFT_186344 [Sistotremastrum suecicum HHB10207 ss-3]